MAFVVPSPSDLGLYLGLAEIDGERAELLLDQATKLAATIVTPLPDGASVVILAAAGRAYANPQGVSYEVIGPMSVQRPQPGLYFTRQEERALKRMSGRGGAFTVDPTPETADPSPTWPVDGTYGPGLEYEPGWGWV